MPSRRRASEGQASRPVNGRSSRALVAPKSASARFVKVYVDGALIGRYKLTNAKFLNGRIIARFSWAANGHHRIRIVNAKTGMRVNLDAFIVLK